MASICSMGDDDPHSLRLVRPGFQPQAGSEADMMPAERSSKAIEWKRRIPDSRFMSAIDFSKTGGLNGTPYQIPPDTRHRILVAEDDDDIRRFNSEALTCSGYKVDAVADGAAAWDALQFNGYDLLVTDYNMPRMSGVELLLKLHAARMTLPVILASGTIPTEQLKRHPWLQIDATLLKPYAPDELLAAVGKVLKATDAI